MVHRQLFNSLVELALQIVSLLLQFLLKPKDEAKLPRLLGAADERNARC